MKKTNRNETKSRTVPKRIFFESVFVRDIFLDEFTLFSSRLICCTYLACLIVMTRDYTYTVVSIFFVHFVCVFGGLTTKKWIADSSESQSAGKLFLARDECRQLLLLVVHRKASAR